MSKRRLKSAIVGSVVAVLATLAALRAVDLAARREQALNEAERRAANLAHVSAEYLREVFAVTDASLRQLALLGRRIGPPVTAGQDWVPVLNAARAGLTGVGSLSVTDAEGVIRASTIETITGQSRQQDYVFRRLASQPDDVVVASTPFRTLTRNPQIVIPMGRRLTTDDGGFIGTVVATLIPAELRGFFRSVDLGPGGVVWVFHPEGVVLIHEPSRTNPIGETALGNPLFEASRRTSVAATRGIVSPGAPPMVSAFETSKPPSLVVAVSLSQRDVLSGWRREVSISVTIVAVSALIAAAVLLLLVREIDARSLAQAQAAADLTARRVAEARADLAEELKRKNAELEAFSYSISHDLRAPLRHIDGFSQLLLSEHARQLEPGAQRYLRIIRESTQNMARMIDDLLNLSRIDRQPPVWTDTDLDVIVERVVRDSQSEIGTRAVDWKIGPLPRVACDAGLITLVFANLISNAVKYTSRRERAVIEVMRQPGTEPAVFMVRDNGAGFDQRYAHRLFGVFQRLHRSEEFDGTGIGLATVARIVGKHGGRVWAEGEVDKGATFFFTLGKSAPDGPAVSPPAAP